VFVRLAPVFQLHLGGRVIRTTGEHPFYADGQGWVAAERLEIGDHLLSLDGEWVAVTDRLETGDWVQVYNLRVADHHTYFVGAEDWGFAVWAHNSRCALADTLAEAPEFAELTRKQIYETLGARKLGSSADAKGQSLEAFARQLSDAFPGRQLSDATLDAAKLAAEVHGNLGRMPTGPAIDPTAPNPYTPGTVSYRLYARIQALTEAGVPGTDQLIRNLHNPLERLGLDWHLDGLSITERPRTCWPWSSRSMTPRASRWGGSTCC
jgi:Pretoxin HINT domain